MLNGWKNLESISMLDDAIANSSQKPVVLFKHSTRCSISTMALNRLKNIPPNTINTIDAYYLDLIAHRDVSNAIAEKLHVYHESPQVLILKNGVCTFDASHTDITVSEILEQLS
jgi:bacillithiol system protein YtxJ